MADFKYSAGIDINLNVKSASSQLKDLQNQLQQISNMDFNLSGLNISEEISEASKAALELQSHLKAATNISTGNLDFTKLNTSLKQSEISLEEYGRKLISLGPEGQKAFMSLSTAISNSEIQVTKSSKVLNTAFENLKKTIGWQLSSSVVNSFTGAIQTAVGYAQDLNKSLTDIRIVTGASTEQMASFAREANAAAKQLSTTTTDYTKASLIYYQQGLSDAEVKARTETTIKMANATGTSAQTVSDQMTAIWNNFDNGTKSLEYYADVMTALGAATASSTDEIVEGLQKFASISDTVGLSYEYAASALATITSTSRESADVVGNSLKTLFSRIQGLQLGETLDDGTDLNKYSAAMAKVGISIKDSSGELKDMDTILDEMGNTWQSLANDEKMALAQTVAGVRQYTQLMTLMENWDEFKQNVSIANTSGGTLDQQAEIYAQSWEAASNRMRAAFEGLWDNLIDSNGAIGVLDFFTNIISGVDGLVSSLGGAKGTLLTFSGLFMKLFGDNIAKNVKEIATDVYQMTPFFAKKQEDAKQGRIAELGRAADEQFGKGSARSQTMQKIAKAQMEEDATRDQRYSGLTEQEKELLKAQENKIKTARDQQLKGAEQEDLGREQIANAVTDNFNQINLGETYTGGMKAIKAAFTEEDQATLKALREKKEQIELESEESKKLKQLEMKEKKAQSSIDSSFYDKGQSRGEVLKSISKSNDDFLASVNQKINERIEGDSTDDFIESLGKVAEQNKINKSEFTDQLGKIFKENGTLTNTDIEKIAQKMTSQRSSDVVEDMDISDAAPATDEEEEGIRKGYRDYGEGYDKVNQGKRIREAGEKNEEDYKKDLISGQGRIGASDWAESLVNASEGLISAAAAGESFNAVLNSFADGTATLSSTLTGLAAGVSSAANGFQGLNSALSNIPGLSAKAATGLSLAMTALLAIGSTILDWAEKKITSSEERAQNLHDSNNELTTAANTTEEAVTLARTQNEAYLKSVEKTKSLSSSPAEIAENIYEANKQALDLIQNYNLSPDQYTTGTNGLIQISERVLDQAVENKEVSAKQADYAEVVGQSVNNLTKVTTNLGQQNAKTDQIINSALGVMTPAQVAATGIDPQIYAQLNQPVIDSMREEIIKAWDNRAIDPEAWNELKNNHSTLDWDKIESALIDKDRAGLEYENAERMAHNANTVVANKMLADAGVSGDSEGYGVKADIIAEEIGNITRDAAFLQPGDNSALTDAQAATVASLLQEFAGVKGAGQFQSENGYIKYKGEGDTEYSHITRETLNAWNAQKEIAAKQGEILSKANSDWTNAVTQFGEGAAEAGMQVKRFGTVAGASVSSVEELYRNQDKWNEAFKESTSETANKEGESERVSRLFGTAAEGYADGFISQIGLSGSEALNHLDFGTLETLFNSLESTDYSSFQGLFQAIAEATGATEGKDLANILTLLSNLDFSQNNYLNLLNLKSMLEDLGYSIDEGNLPAIYAWLAAIVGLGTGEDLGKTADTLTEQKGILNKIAPGESVNEETKEDAIVEGGLNRADFVRNENDEWTYTGTQEDIDNARQWKNQVFGETQTQIDEGQQRYQEYKADGGQYTGFDNTGDLVSAITATETDTGAWWNPLNNTTSPTDQANKLMSLLGITPEQVAEITNWEPYLTDFNNMTMGEDTQSTKISDYMAQVTSSSEIMQSVTGAQERGDTSGFIDANGVISDAAIARLESLPETSERAAGAINDYINIARELNALNEEADTNDDGEVSDDEAEAYNNRTNNLLDQTQAAYEAAEAEAYLQSQIDSVAEANGLDADMLAARVSQFEDSVQQRVDSNGKLIESTEDYHQRLLLLATDYEENTEGLADLQDAVEEYNDAGDDVRQQEKSWEDIRKAISKITKLPLNKVTDEMIASAKASGTLEKALNGDVEAIEDLEKEASRLRFTDMTTAFGQAAKAVADSKDDLIHTAEDMWTGVEEALASTEMGDILNDVVTSVGNAGDMLNDLFVNTFSKNLAQNGGDAAQAWADTCQAFTDNGIIPEVGEGGTATFTAESQGEIRQFEVIPLPNGGQKVNDLGPWVDPTNKEGEITPPKLTFSNGRAGGSSSGSGGGGGGGGSSSEPKKVANKRKSQTVKRYKRNDAKRTLAETSKSSAENKKDYLYGESKIAQMEKINKLAEKEAKITADRIQESQKYLVEDRQNVISYFQKYGFEAEFDADGTIANYEEVMTSLYEELAALYEDNELTEDEEDLEEAIEIKIEEIEGAMEDYENSLSELSDDIEAYEESLYEMFDNEIEMMEHKVEYKLELDEDSLEYIDYLIDNLGDSAVRAIDKITTISEKTDYLFNSIDTAYQSVQEIYDLSDSPLHLFATGGYDIDGLLTESQVEALRDQADSLIDFADQLRDIRDTIQEQVAEVFDLWTEKINHNLSALEHYGSVLEYFKNIVDLTGNDIFGLSTDFIRNMKSTQINQSIDQMESNKAYYEQLQEMRTNVEYELQKAEMSGDEERIAYWEEHLRTLDEEMQSAQDSMLASLESTLTMISDQFTAAMEDAVEAFNESIYSSGGLEGLSADYSLLREEADLMAEDYDKIYQLSKISRNINKTLDDTKIIAGKQRLNGLLSEINDLQASGVEMSKYDLEYLEAKYQLYLAQIELENSQHDKDTVRLTRDSEGNWGYVYTTNEEKVNEAQQKYEDALYEMQNKNHEYLEEMSSSVIDLTQQMNEEIAGLEISDFANLEEYNARVEEIQQKYLAQIERRESELDKAITNNQDLYEKDWKAYSEMTGYKISADKDWIDSFKETTLGYLTESESVFSDFGTRITEYAATLAEELSGAAGSYFSQIEETLQAYDSSIVTFGAGITSTYKSIQDSSDLTAQKTTDMATQMKDAFEEVVTTVGTWQDTDGLEITEMLDEIATYLKDIFDAINKSANIDTSSNSNDLIGSQQAVNELNAGATSFDGNQYDLGSWKFNSRGDLDVTYNGETRTGTNFVSFNALLIEELDDILDHYFSLSEADKEAYKPIVDNAIKKYWAFRHIIDRVYDPGDGEMATPNIPSSYDTGGYTGEWGEEGKLAMLHEKELVLSASDTANFLEALNISRDVIHSMIEMNARASSLGLGDMIASSIKDNTQTIEQTVHITAEFPEATDRDEIEAAFDNLINMASQYAFRSE